MATKRKTAAIDWTQMREQLRAQFSGLDPNDPSRWPQLPKALLFVSVTAFVFAALWYVWASAQADALEAARQQEVQLRNEFVQKLSQAVALDMRKAQLEQVRQYVAQLEKQLPSRAEMDALLSDINQAGVGRGLQFEFFRPGQEEIREYYAELPITLRVAGSYHDIGMFVSDVAHLSRIVILNDLAIQPAANRPDILTMEAKAKTFRYLDPDEVAAQRAAKKAQGGSK